MIKNRITQINIFLPFYYNSTELLINTLIKKNLPQIHMKSKTSIPSSKSLLSIDTKKLINQKCKQDHFGYKKQLPIKKNLSSYTSAYQDIDPKNIVERLEAENYRYRIAPASLDNRLLKRSLHQSTVHFSKNKDTTLPSLKVGSTYNQSFHEKSSENIVKGKQQAGFFIKMPWHESPSTVYKKSFETSNIEVSQSPQKGRPQQDHIKIIRRPFKANSNYEESFSKSGRNHTVNDDSSQCIKSKDHLTGIYCQMKGQSEYKSRFDKSQNKQNRPSSKSIDSRKKINLLPEIKPLRKYQKEDYEGIPKKSIKMQKTQSSQLEGGLKKSFTHKKMFSNLAQ